MTIPMRPRKTALVPIGLDGAGLAALAAARLMAAEVTLVGVVPMPVGQTLSAGVRQARPMRKQLAALAAEDVRIKSAVIVSGTPWQDLLAVIADEEPEVLILEWQKQAAGLGFSGLTALGHPPCDVVVVSGPLPARLNKVLVAARGGPYAELALQTGLSLNAAQLDALHITLTGATDAPFKGLRHILRQMPEVNLRTLTTDDAVPAILRESHSYDAVVLGATGGQTTGASVIGPVAERLLRESSAAVFIVKTRRPMSDSMLDETAGAQAISILVDKWFAENTFHADEFADLKQLLALKEKQGLTISLALPALNEEETVGKVIRTVKRALVTQVPLLDEIVVIDSNSTDRTRRIAERLGVPVHIHQELLPELGARRGKGEALWKSLLVTRGDLVVWVDTDIVNIHPRFVYGVLGPLLLNPKVQFVKGFYRRPLKVGDKVQAGGGGRVTELTARPLLNLFYPELSGVVQPLSGEYAGRRTALEQAIFFSGYGVEIGLLIDMLERHGLGAIAQVDLLERVHHSQELDALSKMSFAIIQTVLRKLERRYERALVEDVNKTMKLIRYDSDGYYLDVDEIAERERPPMIEVPAYQARRGQGT